MSQEQTVSATDREEIKERFKEELGYWHPSFDQMLDLDPGFMDAYREFLAYPWNEGPLDRKTKALVCLAVHSAPTLMNREATRRYADLSFEYGASLEEVVEVIELVSNLGIHSITTGVPILVDEAGVPEYDEEGEADLERIREEFREKREYWDEGKEPRLRIDPGHFEQYQKFSSYPWENGVLDPKVREFIYISIDASVTHVFDYGTRVHMQNALEQGATREEILEVLQLATDTGLNSVQEGIPLVMKMARKHGKL